MGEPKKTKTTHLAINGKSSYPWKQNNKIVVAVIDMNDTSCKLSETKKFNVDDARLFTRFLNGLATGSVIAVVTIGDAGEDYDSYYTTLRTLFDIKHSDMEEDEDGYAFIGKIGDTSFTRFKYGSESQGVYHLGEILLPFSK